MDFADQIAALASRAVKQLEHISTEEATKNALVLPFINALGYNVFDPTEVVPEFTCDVGMKKGEKVDYAIMLEGKPIMLFECKHAGAPLNVEHASQLFRYFAVTEARIGILTNGINYLFFTDLEAPNKMDERPFLEFDLNDQKEIVLVELKKLAKSAFNLNDLLSAAHELKYTKALKHYLNEQWSAPSDELVKFLTKRVYDGLVTQTVRDQFSGFVKRALHQFLNDRISDRLKSALREEEQPVTLDEIQGDGAPSNEASVIPGVGGLPDDDIDTTEEEMEGFRIIRAILREVVDVKRVVARDVKSYFGILLDDNNRKPICRLRFNTAQKYLCVINADKTEEKIPIDSLDDIYKYADRVKAAVLIYESPAS